MVEPKELRNKPFLSKFDISDSAIDSSCIQTASFRAHRELHKLEAGDTSKYAYSLSVKALKPTNFKRKNVKLALGIFNSFVAEGLIVHADAHYMNHAAETAQFIQIIICWWSILKVKAPGKGACKRDVYQEPVRSVTEDARINFLEKFLDWLEAWGGFNHDTGFLTNETYVALKQTTYGLFKFSRYCIAELGHRYLLLGKVQTDRLEARFVQYRQPFARCMNARRSFAFKVHFR